jgi:hypothetical protein
MATCLTPLRAGSAGGEETVYATYVGQAGMDLSGHGCRFNWTSRLRVRPEYVGLNWRVVDFNCGSRSVVVAVERCSVPMTDQCIDALFDVTRNKYVSDRDAFRLRTGREPVRYLVPPGMRPAGSVGYNHIYRVRDLLAAEARTREPRRRRSAMLTPRAQKFGLPTGPVTYLIRAASATGRIKIGQSIDVRKRLLTLQAASPVLLNVVATLPGLQHEAELHRRFASQRRHGEWFDPSSELLDLCRAHSTGAPIGGLA